MLVRPRVTSLSSFEVSPQTLWKGGFHSLRLSRDDVGHHLPLPRPCSPTEAWSPRCSQRRSEHLFTTRPAWPKELAMHTNPVRPAALGISHPFSPRLCSHLPWSHKPSAATICLVFSQYMLLSIQFKLPKCFPGAGTCAGGLTPPWGSGWARAAAAPTWDLVLLRRNLLAPRLASWLHPHNHLFLLLTGINNYPTNRPLLVSTSHWRLELILHFTMFLFGY